MQKLATKSGLTLLFALMFFYFWQYGPLRETQPVFQLAGGESHFLKPIMIDEKRAAAHTFGVIDDESDEHHGYRLINWFKPAVFAQYDLIGERKKNHALDPTLGYEILQRAKKVVGDGDLSYVLKTADELFYVEITQHEKVQSIYIETTHITNDIKGYAGPIKLALVVSVSGRIHDVHYLGSDETPSYMDKIKDLKFYDQFRKMELQGDHPVDAISGATLSTQAMARSINKLVEMSAEYPLADMVDGKVSSFSTAAILSQTWLLHAAGLTLLFLFVAQRFWRKSRRVMMVFYAITVGYIGFYLNNSFTWISLLHPFMGVSISMLLAWYVALVLLGVIWDNNSYCKHLCPFGNVQKLLLRVLPWRMPMPFTARQLNASRFVLTLVLATGIFLGLRQWSSYELFPDLFSLDVMSLWFWAAMVVILASGFWPMLWCRALCPTGAVLDGVTHLAQQDFLKKRKVIPIIPEYGMRKG